MTKCPHGETERWDCEECTEDEPEEVGAELYIAHAALQAENIELRAEVASERGDHQHTLKKFEAVCAERDRFHVRAAEAERERDEARQHVEQCDSVDQKRINDLLCRRVHKEIAKRSQVDACAKNLAAALQASIDAMRKSLEILHPVQIRMAQSCEILSKDYVHNHEDLRAVWKIVELLNKAHEDAVIARTELEKQK